VILKKEFVKITDSVFIRQIKINMLKLNNTVKMKQIRIHLKYKKYVKFFDRVYADR